MIPVFFTEKGVPFSKAFTLAKYFIGFLRKKSSLNYLKLDIEKIK